MNLLITGAWQQGKENLDRIRQLGHQVCFAQQEKDPLPCGYDWVEGVVCNGLFLHHPMEKFPNLRYVQLTSVGFDRVPMADARRRGILVHNARDVYSIPMAEYALGGVLQLYRGFSFFGENQKKHLWEKHRDLKELAGKQVCIVGCGSVGSECAKRFSVFGCTVTGVATREREQPFFARVVSRDALLEAVGEADVVILALPLSDETRYLLDGAAIAAMKPGAVVVNIARGAVLDTGALETALRSGHLSGAVLDVFEEEPLAQDSPLWDLENVIITPHNSFVGDGTARRLTGLILSGLQAI